MAHRIGVVGATGRMGRLVLAELIPADDLDIVAAVTHPGSVSLGLDIGALAGHGPQGRTVIAQGPGCVDECDVVIDFSTPGGLAALLDQLPERCALVSGTTGLDATLVDRLAERAQRAPVLVAANFSTGVAVLRDLVARAAAALPDYDIEIVEAHHKHKRDAPSGTALALGRAAAGARGWTLDATAQHGREGDTGPRQAASIGFHAVRGGGVVGEHQVWIVGGGERLELTHAAMDRATFAQGAVRAARWIVDQPAGRYGLPDVLGLTTS